jgi:hypothetical protein
MGADSLIVYYGVRYQITDPAELKELGTRTHPLIKRARQFGLQVYWGNFAVEGGEYNLLLIGREIGAFGLEGLAEKELADSEFLQIQQETRERLGRGGFSLVPALQILFEPDY